VNLFKQKYSYSQSEHELERKLNDTGIYARPPGSTEGRRRKVVIEISKLRMVQSVVHLSAKLKAAALR
jgi:hypothetical protein